jgi:hypothetical protein
MPNADATGARQCNLSAALVKNLEKAAASLLRTAYKVGRERWRKRMNDPKYDSLASARQAKQKRGYIDVRLPKAQPGCFTFEEGPQTG